MPTLFWTGKLSLPMTLLVNASNLLSLFNRTAHDTSCMKQRVQDGYDGVFTDHVTRYDELGLKFQIKAARAQIEELDVKGKTILDVGAGTGASSFLLLERGAKKVVCGDISSYMLNICRKKAIEYGYSTDKIDFSRLDAESLPFEDNSFDMVITGMTLGLLPDQKKAISEMARVVRQGGCVAVGAHGPEHYWEAIDAYFNAITKWYVIGYRMEWWPRKEKEIKHMLSAAGISKIKVKRVIWRNIFPSGNDAYDFFAAISAAFWYAKFPPDKRIQDARKVRNYFEKKKIIQITDDIILVHGFKP
ncbi:MAG: methyltransferase domain-containing protein [Dehalococcoidia bacterium]